MIPAFLRSRPLVAPYARLPRAYSETVLGHQFIEDVLGSQDFLEFMHRRNQRELAKLAAQDAASQMAGCFEKRDWQ